MNKNKRAWSMKIKKCGSASPPKKGYYGGLVKLGSTPFKRLNGRVALLTSISCVWSYAKCYRNPPVAPPYRNSLKKILRGLSLKKNRIGTLQGELSYWKGQKREPMGVCK